MLQQAFIKTLTKMAYELVDLLRLIIFSDEGTLFSPINIRKAT